MEDHTVTDGPTTEPPAATPEPTPEPAAEPEPEPTPEAQLDPEPAADPQPGTLPADVAAAETAKARQQAARYRGEARENRQRLEAILDLLGESDIDPDLIDRARKAGLPAEPTPDDLAAENRTLTAENRTLTDRIAVLERRDVLRTAAVAAGADPDLTVAYLESNGRAATLTDADDRAAQAAELVKSALEAKPTLAAGRPAPSSPRSAPEPPGTQSPTPGLEDLDTNEYIERRRKEL